MAEDPEMFSQPFSQKSRFGKTLRPKSPIFYLFLLFSLFGKSHGGPLFTQNPRVLARIRLLRKVIRLGSSSE